MSARGAEVETECSCGTAALELGEVPVGAAVDRGAGRRTQQESRCQRMLGNLSAVIRAHPRVHSYKVSMETGYAVGEQPRPQQTYEEYRCSDVSYYVFYLPVIIRDLALLGRAWRLGDPPAGRRQQAESYR